MSSSYHRGMDALNAGDLATAAANFKQALQANPNHAPSWNGLGIALLRQGRTEEALQLFSRGSQLGSPAAQSNYNAVAAWLEQRRRYDSQVKQYADKLEGWAENELKKGNIEQAKQAFLTASKYDPANAKARAAIPYIEALRREQAKGNVDQQRRREQEAEIAREAAGNPAWIADALAALQGHLRKGLEVGSSTALAQARKTNVAGASFIRDFFDNPFGVAPEQLVPPPGTIGGIQQGSQLEPGTVPSDPRPQPPLQRFESDVVQLQADFEKATQDDDDATDSTRREAAEQRVAQMRTKLLETKGKMVNYDPETPSP